MNIPTVARRNGWSIVPPSPCRSRRRPRHAGSRSRRLRGHPAAGAYTIFSNSASTPTELRPRNPLSTGADLRHRPNVRRPIRARLHDSQPQEVPVRSAPAPAPAACLPAAGKTGTSTTPGSLSPPSSSASSGRLRQQSELPPKAPRRPPIWTEFMKRAHRYREYAARRSSNRQTASPPSISILSTTATGACPPRPEVFIAGTSPSNLPLPQQAAVRSLADAWSRPPLPASHPRHPRPNRPPRAHPSRRRIRCRLNNCNYPPQEGRRGFDRFEYI